MDQIVVGVADCRIGTLPGQILTTYALGSCIALAVYDAPSGLAGLLHFMLPDSAIDPARSAANPYMFGDSGIRALLSEFLRRGCAVRRLAVHAIGGAQMIDSDTFLDIGRRNYLATRKILWKAGVLLRGEEVGGSVSRTVRLEAGTGRIWIQERGIQRELGSGYAGAGGRQCPTGS